MAKNINRQELSGLKSANASLREKLPDFCELGVPSLEGIIQILDDPVITFQLKLHLHSFKWQGAAQRPAPHYAADIRSSRDEV